MSREQTFRMASGCGFDGVWLTMGVDCLGVQNNRWMYIVEVSFIVNTCFDLVIVIVIDVYLVACFQILFFLCILFSILFPIIKIT